MKNLTYRFLTEADYDIFIDIHSRKNKFMNNLLTPQEKEAYLSRLSWLWKQPDYKVVGCFDGNKLVGVSGGRFYKDKGLWYGHGQCFDLGEVSLKQASLYATVHYQTGIPLMKYAESMGIFKCMASREVQEGDAFTKFRDRLARKGIENYNYRYNYIVERIYYPGDSVEIESHKFFFKPDDVVKIPTMVCSFEIKPEYKSV